MAANKTLDPSSCTTASDAFKYPLPQVRQFHRTLTADLDEKNARLRTLVGGSYRQLLGTAEMILHMREDIKHVEDKLSRLGKECGRTVIGGKATGLARLQNRGADGKHGDGMEWAAKIKVLEMCEISIGRLLKEASTANHESKDGRGTKLVLAAKVLVLSRLLAKSVGDLAAKNNSEDREMVEGLRRKLASLRRRLLRAIDKTLEKTGGNTRDDLTQALCAYSLATSSGAKDTVEHFLGVRRDAIRLSFEDDADSKDENSGILKALEFYTRTLLDVQALIPRRLPEALAGLKKKALLKDKAIRMLEGLRLDVCEKRFGDEILFFTPYIRHDDIEASQAVATLKAWAKKASAFMLQALTRALEHMAEFKSVVTLRTKVLEIWIKEGGRARGFDPSILLDGLRKAVNDRMVELLESRVSKLHLVATEIEGTLGSWRDGITDIYESLWEDAILEMDVSSGAVDFKEGIIARTYGRNIAVSRALRGYQTWRHLVNEITVVIEQLRKQRWDDDLEDIEDDLTLESRNTLLSVEDPQMLQEQLNASLSKGFSLLHEKIASLLSVYDEDENIGHISIYVIRLVRDIRADLPKPPSLQMFGLSLVPTLHDKTSCCVSANSLEAFEKALQRKRVPGRALWEGSPELPVQPSPRSFKLLRDLILAMGNMGSDLWSPRAVTVLKQHLRLEISRRWAVVLDEQAKMEPTIVNGATTNDTNGAAEAEDPKEMVEVEDPKKWEEVLIQSLFDVLVLRSAFEISEQAAEDELEGLERTIESHLGVEPALKKRLQQSANEYWKRTSLLFGLLS